MIWLNLYIPVIYFFNDLFPDVSDFRLNTERRSVQRHDFEEKKHVRDANLRVADEERHRQSEEEEREAIARLRKEMEHKDNPIRKFARMEVLPSDRPLTQPESPHFETKMRLRSHERLWWVRLTQDLH